jgi:hypothetical protein
MKHLLKIKEAESFLQKLKDGTYKRKYRYHLRGDKASLKQFKLDTLAKTNLQGWIGKDREMCYYSFTALPKGQIGTIIRLTKGEWIIDTSDMERMQSLPLHPDVAKAAGQAYANMLLGKSSDEPDDDIFDDDTEDEDDNGLIIPDEFDEFTDDDEEEEDESEGDPF